MKQFRDQRRVPLPTGFFKINTNSGHNLNSGLAWSVAVACDEHGRWMWRLGRNIGRCSVLQVEFWAIYDGPQLA